MNDILPEFFWNTGVSVIFSYYGSQRGFYLTLSGIMVMCIGIAIGLAGITVYRRVRG